MFSHASQRGLNWTLLGFVTGNVENWTLHPVDSIHVTNHFFSVSNMSNLHAWPIYVVVDPNVRAIHPINMFQYLFPLLQVHIGFVLSQSSLTSVSTTSDGNEKFDSIYLSILLTSPKTNKFVLNWTLFVHVTHPAEIWTQKNWTLAITRHSGWTLGRNGTVSEPHHIEELALSLEGVVKSTLVTATIKYSHFE